MIYSYKTIINAMNHRITCADALVKSFTVDHSRCLGIRCHLNQPSIARFTLCSRQISLNRYYWTHIRSFEITIALYASFYEFLTLFFIGTNTKAVWFKMISASGSSHVYKHSCVVHRIMNTITFQQFMRKKRQRNADRTETKHKHRRRKKTRRKTLAHTPNK